MKKQKKIITRLLVILLVISIINVLILVQNMNQKEVHIEQHIEKAIYVEQEQHTAEIHVVVVESEQAEQNDNKGEEENEK